ncbi:hypothetical protein CRYUN_Cryun09bG0021100 [Craigia yunnanensis]
MGQKVSCRENHETALLSAVQTGDLEMLQAMVEADPSTLKRTTRYGKLSILHVAAIYGQIEILSFILDRCPNSDILNRHRQTPLMLAAMHGKTDCVKKLIQSGAYVLMFDSLQGRICLHYAAYYGHFDCLQALLSAAHSSPLANSWGFARFVNIRDENGATPLHLAARQGWSNCVHALLDNGALVCASTGGNGCEFGLIFGLSAATQGARLAARGGFIECIRELLAWGADRLQPDSYGRIPYGIAMKHKHEACAALLNPASAEPLVWPLPLRFISDLNPEAKELLEKALMEANREREKAILKETIHALPSASDYEVEADDTATVASDIDVCCICFDQICTIEIRQCGHRMCAHCTLALCRHKKPNPLTASPVILVCPFCRRGITQLVVAKINNNESETEASPLRLSSGKIINNDTGAEFSASKPIKSRKSNFSEGSSFFKGLSAISSFRKMGSRSAGKVPAECSEGNKKF